EAVVVRVASPVGAPAHVLDAQEEIASVEVGLGVTGELEDRAGRHPDHPRLAFADDGVAGVRLVPDLRLMGTVVLLVGSHALVVVPEREAPAFAVLVALAVATERVLPATLFGEGHRPLRPVPVGDHDAGGRG